MTSTPIFSLLMTDTSFVFQLQGKSHLSDTDCTWNLVDLLRTNGMEDFLLGTNHNSLEIPVGVPG
jgi:hypothetical protein